MADVMSRPCNNGMESHKVSSLLRLLPTSRLRTLCCSLLFAALVSPVWGRGHATQQTQLVPPPLLVLSGGTIIDVTAWGHSANDIPDAVVFIRDGHIVSVGPRSVLPIPKGARVIDCTGKFLIPGLVDGFAGMNSQAQANANLYMGVTTVVAAQDERRGAIDQHANPTPHLYLADSIGSTDDWSLLIREPAWAQKLKDPAQRSVELSPEDTSREMQDTAKLGTRVLVLGHDITAANAQWIIDRAHQMGLITYGEFTATPYRVGVQAGVDVLLHMGRYELGVIPDELQQPLVEDPEGSASRTAYGYAGKVPVTDLRLREYARFLATHHTALMPTFSQYYLQLPGHRNLWHDPAAQILPRSGLDFPSNAETGELNYPLASWTKHLPNATMRWMEENQRKKADLEAGRLWAINRTIFLAYPHYLAASGAPVMGTMPGISLHTELEMLVRLGLSPREALAAATNNYAEQFHWTELGQILPGRRADVLVLDGDPTANIWNARRINTLVVDGNVIDREGLLKR
ncbi:MAG TPA: amidohydrolase family protein [Acidobacteriaceae bacterium]